MVFSTKSLVSILVLVVLVVGAVSFSGVDISGDFSKKAVPWWCIKDPVYHPPQGTSGEYTPSVSRGNGKGVPLPGGYSSGTYTPGLQRGGSFRQPDFTAKIQNPIDGMKASISGKFGKIESGTTSGSRTSGGSSGSGSRGGDTIFKGKTPGTGLPGVGNIPGISVSGEYPPSQGGDGEETPKDGYWNWQLVCPNGHSPDYSLLQQCPRIKNFLEKGIYTEATLPPELKKILPLCKKASSWFSVPKQSPDDCDALFMKVNIYGWNKLTGEEASKFQYCQNMQPNQSGKTWDKFRNICVEAKKTGKKLSPDLEKACGKFFWYNQLIPKNDCKDLFKLTSDYIGLGGDACDLPIGSKTYACIELYPELNPSASAVLNACGDKGGG